MDTIAQFLNLTPIDFYFDSCDAERSNINVPWNKGVKGYRLDYNHSEETKLKISLSLKYKVRSVSHSANISISKKGKRPKVLDFRRSYKGKNNPNYGNKVSSESRKKMSNSHKKLTYIVEGVHYNCLEDIAIAYNLESRAAALYRVKSSSTKFREWNYGN